MGSLFNFTNNDNRYKETRYNIALFYYCSDKSVYVITTNSAWTLVQNYRDPEFPQKIADRLLTLNGAKDRSNKPLFSEISKTSERRKYGNKSATVALDEPYICLNYAARLRDDASIYKLDCFVKKLNSPVNVLINYGSIRFQCPIKVDSIKDVIEHLHRIYMKERTTKYNKQESTTEDEVEEDSSVYRHYLQIPDFEVRTALNLHLVKILRKSILENDDNEIENFQIMHLKMDDFLDATEFKLIITKKQKKEIVINGPNLKLVIDTIRKNKIIDTNPNGDNDFRKELKKIHISFKSKTEQIEEELLNCLEGMVAYNHLYYFRAFKKWYYISEDYYRHIQFCKIAYWHKIANLG